MGQALSDRPIISFILIPGVPYRLNYTALTRRIERKRNIRPKGDGRSAGNSATEEKLNIFVGLDKKNVFC